MRNDADRGGFTLLEAIVALAIVGAVLVGGLMAGGHELRASRKAADATTAAVLGEDRLERAALLTPAELTALRSGGEGRFPAPFEDFIWRHRAHPVPGEPALWEVTVEVEWPDGSIVTGTRVTSGGATPGGRP